MVRTRLFAILGDGGMEMCMVCTIREVDERGASI